LKHGTNLLFGLALAFGLAYAAANEGKTAQAAEHPAAKAAAAGTEAAKAANPEQTPVNTAAIEAGDDHCAKAKADCPKGSAQCEKKHAKGARHAAADCPKDAGAAKQGECCKKKGAEAKAAPEKPEAGKS
jgi:hypothetical protein